jgi:hypothetical protein
MRFSIISCCVVGLLAFGQHVEAGTVLNPGEILQVTFTTNSVSCSGVCDSLIINANESGAFSLAGFTAQLFNATTLLGTDTDPAFCCAGYYHSSTSLSLQGPVVDFTAIDNGTINGVVDFSIPTGSMTWLGAPTFSILLAHASGPVAYIGGSGLTITSEQILAPEPGTMSMMLLAASLALGVYFRRRQA